MTRFGEISPLWQNLKSLWQFFEGKFSIWQHLWPILANFVCSWANFNWWKWSNIEKILQTSGHTVIQSCLNLISSTPSRYCRIVSNKLMVPPYLHLAFKIDWIDPPSALNKNINKMSQITFFIFVKSWSCLV